MIKTKDLYSFDHSLAGAYLEQFEYPWQALKGIGDLIKTLSKDLSKDDYEEKEPGVFVHKTARIYPSTYLGAPCIIGANTEVRPGAFIRGNALVGEDCVVGNSTELKNVILFDHTYLGAPCIIGANTEVRPGAFIRGNALVGEDCVVGNSTELKNVILFDHVQVPHYNYVGDSILVRPGAFIRGNALVGEDCVVGNSTELKNVILFDHVQVPHYNYVGDSILGYYSHMGAGSITSNVKSDKTLVVVKDKDEEIKTGLKKMGAMLGDHVEVGCNSVLNPGTIIGKESDKTLVVVKDKDEEIKTGLKKMGAMLGDHVEVGCNSVLNPGTIIGKGTSIYPLSCVRHVVPAGMIYKDKDHITKRDDKH